MLAAWRACPTLAVMDLRGLGTQPIDRVLAVSGVERAVETSADPATLDPLRP